MGEGDTCKMHCGLQLGLGGPHTSYFTMTRGLGQGRMWP